jgi:hypothetical protein
MRVCVRACELSSFLVATALTAAALVSMLLAAVVVRMSVYSAALTDWLHARVSVSHAQVEHAHRAIGATRSEHIGHAGVHRQTKHLACVVTVHLAHTSL